MVLFVVMGVSGAGKTSLGAALAARLRCPFQEGDDLHPAANRTKMASGIPLTDEDRAPWLGRIADWINARPAGGHGVISCSVLKKAYRDRIIPDRRKAILVYIDGERERVRERLKYREGHFMPLKLLDSQYATLEPPGPDEHPVIVRTETPLDEQVRQVMAEARRRFPQLPA